MADFTPALRLYAKVRAAKLRQLNPAAAQRNELLRLIAIARNTRFGRDHGFESIRSVAEYQRRVQLRTYEQFWEQYWQPAFPLLDSCTWPGRIPYFAASSGTSSGTTKYIPCTHAIIQSNNKAGRDLLSYHVLNRPQSRILEGRSFMLGGSTELVPQAPGVFSGDLSGISVISLPAWAKMRYFPPAELALLKNWEEKIDKLARQSLESDIRMISGVPSWLLIFFNRLKELRPESGGKISAIYPQLEMLVHGGVNFAPYHKVFTELLEGSFAEMRETYPASEGFIAVADRGYGDGMRMSLDHGIFFEFVPLEELGSETPTRHWIEDVQPGVNYAIVLTTCAGLWSYIVGDTIKLVDTKPPRVLVTGRTSYQLSAFGEHVIGEEVEDALSCAAAEVGASVRDYSVGAIYPESTGELGGHLYVVEFMDEPPAGERLERFRSKLDERLKQRNEDYEAHRADGYGLRAPELLVAKPGAFAAWMKSRGKLGGQNKVPRLIPDRKLFGGLIDFTNDFNK